jgi:flagellar biosynthesis/type III secretory pathway M-ring protein FliF/YscJ
MIAETICYALTLAGLACSAVTAYRRRFLAATRMTAYALVPAGLAMTGVVKWVEHTAFSPTAWIGFAVLAVAFVLFMTTRTVERHSGRTRKERRQAAKEARAARRRGGQPAAAPDASRPAEVGTGRPTAQTLTRRSGSQGESRQAQQGEDFSEVEAILKKHGI